jgi:hypothetical protein
MIEEYVGLPVLKGGATRGENNMKWTGMGLEVVRSVEFEVPLLS